MIRFHFSAATEDFQYVGSRAMCLRSVRVFLPLWICAKNIPPLCFFLFFVPSLFSYNFRHAAWSRYRLGERELTKNVVIRVHYGYLPVSKRTSSYFPFEGFLLAETHLISIMAPDRLLILWFHWKTESRNMCVGFFSYLGFSHNTSTREMIIISYCFFFSFSFRYICIFNSYYFNLLCGFIRFGFLHFFLFSFILSLQLCLLWLHIIGLCIFVLAICDSFK